MPKTANNFFSTLKSIKKAQGVKIALAKPPKPAKAPAPKFTKAMRDEIVLNVYKLAEFANKTEFTDKEVASFNRLVFEAINAKKKELGIPLDAVKAPRATSEGGAAKGPKPYTDAEKAEIADLAKNAKGKTGTALETFLSDIERTKGKRFVNSVKAALK